MPDGAPDRASRTQGAGRLVRQIPNALTASRLLAIPIILALVLRDEGTSLAGGWLFAAVAVTDYLDGYLARRLGAVSRFGQIADPLCDRLLIAVGVIGLMVLGRVHPAAPAILLGRDVLAIVAFAALARAGYDPKVDRAGKATSALAMVAVAFALGYAFWWTEPLLWVATLAAVVSFANYGLRHVAGRKTRPQNRARGMQ